MVEGLENMLSVLDTKRAQLNFLKTISHPDFEILDLLINKFEDEDTITSEAESAKQSQDIETYEELAKKSVDLSIQRKQIQFFDRRRDLNDVVMKWRDPTITKYAIEKVDSTTEDDKNLYSKQNLLWQTTRFTEKLESDEVHRNQLEKLLAHQQASEDKFASTLEKLGRYDEAIDQYLEEGGIYLEEEEKALELAKTHSIGRVQEIADHIVKNYNFPQTSYRTKLFTECVEITGEYELAIKKIKTYGKSPENNSDNYHIIPALVKFGLIKEAKKRLKRIEREKSNFRPRKIDMTLVDLYLQVGDKAKATEELEEAMQEIESNPFYMSSHEKVDVIEKLAKVTRNPSILDRAISIYQQDGEFEECSRLAHIQNKPALAATYQSMRGLTCDF